MKQTNTIIKTLTLILITLLHTQATSLVLPSNQTFQTLTLPKVPQLIINNASVRVIQHQLRNIQDLQIAEENQVLVVLQRLGSLPHVIGQAALNAGYIAVLFRNRSPYYHLNHVNLWHKSVDIPIYMTNEDEIIWTQVTSLTIKPDESMYFTNSQFLVEAFFVSAFSIGIVLVKLFLASLRIYSYVRHKGTVNFGVIALCIEVVSSLAAIAYFFDPNGVYGIYPISTVMILLIIVLTTSGLRNYVLWMAHVYDKKRNIESSEVLRCLYILSCIAVAILVVSNCSVIGLFAAGIQNNAIYYPNLIFSSFVQIIIAIEFVRNKNRIIQKLNYSHISDVRKAKLLKIARLLFLSGVFIILACICVIISFLGNFGVGTAILIWYTLWLSVTFSSLTGLCQVLSLPYYDEIKTPKIERKRFDLRDNKIPLIEVDTL